MSERELKHDEVILAGEEGETIEERVETWLGERGMSFNPFTELDASRDSRIMEYWTRSDEAFALLRDKVSVCVAPDGYGKSAIRARLVYGYRVGEDECDVFPVTVDMSRKEGLKDEDVARLVGFEWMVQLRRKAGVDLIDDEEMERIEKLMPSLLGREFCYKFLREVESEGNYLALLSEYDIASGWLSRFPGSGSLKKVFRKLWQVGEGLSADDFMDPSEALREFVEGENKEVMMLVDFGDSTLDIVEEASRYIQGLEESLGVGAKYFIRPEQVEASGLVEREKLEIKWDKEKLVKMIEDRIESATRGYYDSLLALSDPSVPWNIEERVVELLGLLELDGPRELLAFLNDVLQTHCEQPESGDELTWNDFNKVMSRKKIGKIITN